MKIIFFLFLFTFSSLISKNDSDSTDKRNFLKKYIDDIIMDTTSSGEPQLLMYPTIAYSPETSWEFGVSSLLIFYANKDTNNRLSEINGFTFYTLENQFGLWFDHAIYLQDDEYISLGKIRLQSFPLFYHGIGSDTPEDYVGLVDGYQIYVKESILKNIHKDIFLGLEFNLQSLRKVDFVPEDGVDVPEVLGIDGSTNLGLGLGLVYNS